jgi:hypothetical protein
MCFAGKERITRRYSKNTGPSYDVGSKVMVHHWPVINDNEIELESETA